MSVNPKDRFVLCALVGNIAVVIAFNVVAFLVRICHASEFDTLARVIGLFSAGGMLFWFNRSAKRRLSMASTNLIARRLWLPRVAKRITHTIVFFAILVGITWAISSGWSGWGLPRSTSILGEKSEYVLVSREHTLVVSRARFLLVGITEQLMASLMPIAFAMYLAWVLLFDRNQQHDRNSDR